MAQSSAFKPIANPTDTQSQLEQDRFRQKQGTGFTNINRVLGANQNVQAGTSAGQRIGSAIGTNLGNQAGQIRKGIEQGQSQFQAANTAGQQPALNKIGISKQLGTMGEGETQDQYNARIAGIGKDTNNPVDFTQAGKDLNAATYTGPSGLANAGQIQSGAANLQEQGNLTNTGAGQGELIRNLVAQRGNYSLGQNALDKVLLAKQGQQGIQQGRQAIGDINQRANSAVNSAAQTATGAASGINTGKTEALNAIRNQYSGINTAAQGKAEEFNKNATRIQQLLSGKNDKGEAIKDLSPEDVQLLNNMNDYGLNSQSNIWMRNSEDPNTLMGKFGSNLDASQKTKYSGNQQQAVSNLNKFLGNDQISQDQIDQSKFNTNVFNPDENLLVNKGQEQMNRDITDKTNFQAASDQAGGVESLLAYHPEWGDTRREGFNVHVAGPEAKLMSMLTPDQQMTARGFNTKQNEFNYMKQALAQNAAERQGQNKSLRQMALERYGQANVLDNPTKKLTQK